MAMLGLKSRTVKSASFLNVKVRRNHYSGEDPSDLIALLDSPRRIWIYRKTGNSKIGRAIFSISVSKLIRMGAYSREDVRKAGIYHTALNSITAPQLQSGQAIIRKVNNFIAKLQEDGVRVQIQ